MEQGMVTAGVPGFAAAGMYFLFGVLVLSVVLYLQLRGHSSAEE